MAARVVVSVVGRGPGLASGLSMPLDEAELLLRRVDCRSTRPNRLPSTVRARAAAQCETTPTFALPAAAPPAPRFAAVSQRAT